MYSPQTTTKRIYAKNQKAFRVVVGGKWKEIRFENRDKKK
jgi:hypothetical protein